MHLFHAGIKDNNRFFYNKLRFVKERYKKLVDEAKYRNIICSDKSNEFKVIKTDIR